jgi:hypothetical protein
MANPNYNRKDVASSAYAKEKEIKSEWYDVPQKAFVPPELYYYAVDQKDFDTKNREQQRIHKVVRDERRPDTDQVVMQAHRWVTDVPFKDNKNQAIPVGDWVVAERMLVYRGEVVGRNERVEVPVWRPRKETMSLLTDSTTRARKPGVEVNFGYNRPPDYQEAVLIDFEGGKQSYAHVVKRSDDPDQKATTVPVNDESSTDVLILTPDGRLQARNSAADTKDEDRVKRLKEVREKIDKWADEGKILNNLLNNPAGGVGGPGGRGEGFGK